MFKEYIKASCPFCNKGVIVICHIPSYVRTSRKSAGKGTATASLRSKTQEWVETDCPSCGKTAKEIEKEFKRVSDEETNKPLSEREKLLKEKERIERLIAAGYNVENGKRKLVEIEKQLANLSTS